jgi:hypothetical protein
MVDPADAENIKIPLCLLASGDEDAGDVKKFEANLKGEKYVETYRDQIHGWSKRSLISYDGIRCLFLVVAARSDLENPRVKEEYERGYKTLLEFFAKHL